MKLFLPFLLLAAVSIPGCPEPDNPDPPTPPVEPVSQPLDEAVAAVWIGIGSVTTERIEPSPGPSPGPSPSPVPVPVPTPTPTPSPVVPRPENCTNCKNSGRPGQVRTGDGLSWSDCEECDRDGDGDPIDFMDKGETGLPNKSEESLGPIWWPSLEALPTKKTTLVLLSKTSPSELVWNHPKVSEATKPLHLVHVELDKEAEDRWIETLQPKGKSPVQGIEKTKDGYHINEPVIVFIDPERNYCEKNVNKRLLPLPKEPEQLASLLLMHSKGESDEGKVQTKVE